VPFSALELHPDLLRGVKDLGFARPTPIQADAIPPALAGRDVLASAMTGSGKTAAFLLPILHRLIDRPRGTTRALVITPTRELAAQILEDLTDLAAHTSVKGAAVFGGVAMGPQERAFRSGVDVIVGTPGRLLDHFSSRYARLDRLEFLVLDEADRMLDMGFLPDIRRVLRHVPAKRQTLFFSATMPPPIIALTRELLSDPATIDVERQAVPVADVTQTVYPVPQRLKPTLLVTLLERRVIEDVLVFTRTKHRAERLAKHLVKAGIAAERIHGNRSQGQRTEALSGFKKGKYRVLVATSIMARGIDVEALGHVVNFDVPAEPDDYIHRVGRTARAGATGDAFTFVSPEEQGDLRQIERAIGSSLPRATVPGFDYRAAEIERFEVPLGERIAAIRARKAEERARARINAARRAAAERARQGGAAPTGPGPRMPGPRQTGQASGWSGRPRSRRRGRPRGGAPAR